MRVARTAWSRGLVMVLCLAGCRTAASSGDRVAAAAPASSPDDDAIRSLPGYHAELVSAPVFGGHVFVMEVGDPAAPAVVLVHGLGESGCRDFYPVLPDMAEHYHVLTFDLPGFGRSTHGTELYSPARYADLIHALLAARRFGPVNLVGHSMGGALALFYAAHHPTEVSRLLLIDVAGVLYRKAFVNFAVEAGIDHLFGPLAEPVKELATVAEESTDTFLDPLVPGSPDPSVILRTATLRATVLGTPTRIAALAVILENFGPVIAAVRAPAWILWGSDDAVASPRTGLVLQARLPSAKLTVLEGSGHDPMATRPTAVTEFLLAALATPAVAPGPTAPAPFPTLPTRTARCEGEQGTRISGDYAAVEIVGCRDVMLKDVRTAALRIRDSFVTVESTRVVTRGTAFESQGSRVVLTASDFVGEVAMDVEGSDLDLAGVELRGQRAAVHVGGASKLIFSVSHADSPINHRYLHGVYEFDIGVEL